MVVHALRAGDVRNVEVLRSLRCIDPSKPVIVEVPERTRLRDAMTYDGIVAVAPPMDAATLVDAVADAMEGRSPGR